MSMNFLHCLIFCNSFLKHSGCPASSGKEKTKCGWIAPRTHSDGPVSQTCLLRLLRRELLRAFVTLDDSTPQRRISELRVWCLMNPLLCSRHHRQVTLAVKTCLACKFFTTVCSSSDLVGSISSLCV